jgi:hypothetical protein
VDKNLNQFKDAISINGVKNDLFVVPGSHYQEGNYFPKLSSPHFPAVVGKARNASRHKH